MLASAETIFAAKRRGGNRQDPRIAKLATDNQRMKDVTVRNAARTFVIRSRTRGDAGKALQATGVALGPTVRFAD